MAAVLWGMADIGAVDVGWRVLDAQFFGVAQRRRRLFVVADFRGQRAGQILALADGLSGHPTPRRETGQGVAIGTGDGASISGAVSSKWAKGSGGPAGDECYNLTIAHPLKPPSKGATWKMDGSDNLVTHTLSPEGHDASEDGTGRGTPLVAMSFSENQRAEVLTSDVVRSITNGGGKPGQGYPAVAMALRGREGGAMAELSDVPSALRASQDGGDKSYVLDVHPTLAASTGGPGSQDWRQHSAVSNGMAVRRLTPRECERLQGFPDDWTAVDGAADSTRYRQLGNAVAVPVAEWIGRRIVEASHA